jgi:hypothetical protein
MNGRTALISCLVIILATGTVAALLPAPDLSTASSPIGTKVLTTITGDRMTVSYATGAAASARTGRVVMIGGDVNYVRSMVVKTDDPVPETGFGETPSRSLAPGARQFHREAIANGTSRLRVDLDWDDPSLAPSLVVYPPDGSTLGPYSDLDDGRRDGRCYLEIETEGRDIASGDWYFRVTGDPDATIPRYTLTTAGAP